MKLLFLLTLFLLGSCIDSSESAGASGAGNPSPDAVSASVRLQLESKVSSRVIAENSNFVQSVFVKIFYLQIISKIDGKVSSFRTTSVEQNLLAVDNRTPIDLPIGIYQNIHLKFNANKSNPSIVISLLDEKFGAFQVEIQHKDLVKVPALSEETQLEENAKNTLNINFPRGDWEKPSFWAECFSKAEEHKVLSIGHSELSCREAVSAVASVLEEGMSWGLTKK